MINLSKGETLELLIRSIYELEMNKKKEQFFTDWDLRDLTEERV